MSPYRELGERPDYSEPAIKITGPHRERKWLPMLRAMAFGVFGVEIFFLGMNEYVNPIIVFLMFPTYILLFSLDKGDT